MRCHERQRLTLRSFLADYGKKQKRCVCEMTRMMTTTTISDVAHTRVVGRIYRHPLVLSISISMHYMHEPVREGGGRRGGGTLVIGRTQSLPLSVQKVAASASMDFCCSAASLDNTI